MKLSKSKLALAKVINENGGWVDDAANFAVQSDGNLRIHFTDDTERPKRSASGGW